MSTAGQVISMGTTRGLTVAVAESLTGGAVCAALVAVPGASAVLRGGVVAYATDLKASLLGVDVDVLADRGPVDPDVALAMAAGVRRLTGASVGVATTGVAGPDSQAGRPPGVVYVGVAGPDGARVASLRLAGDREAIRSAACEAALAELLSELASIAQ